MSDRSAFFKGRFFSLFFFALALFYLLISHILPSGFLRFMIQIFLYAALGEGWNLLSGFAGMTSLGQQLFIGIGGYAAAMTSTFFSAPYPLGLLIGALGSVLIAFLLSRLLFRLSGMYFAICTWVAAEGAQLLFLNWKAANQGAGMTVKLSPYPTMREIHFMSFLLFLLSLMLVWGIMRSRLGLGLIAMREDAQTAAACGVRIERSRLFVYLFSAFLTAFTGGLFFINKGVIFPDSGFGISWTVSLVFICIIGGTGTISGPLSGAVVYVLLREYLAHFPGWSNLILGAVTIAAVLFLPGGLAGLLTRHFPGFFRRAPGSMKNE